MLLDHFRPPLRDFRHWHSLYNAWATFLADDLNSRLPAGWFAEPNVQFGIEIDIAAYEAGQAADRFAIEAASSPTDMAVTSSGKPSITIDFPIIGDMAQVDVFSETEGLVLVGAIELVSPSNKDRPESREAFISKCNGLLRERFGHQVEVAKRQSAVCRQIRNVEGYLDGFIGHAADWDMSTGPYPRRRPHSPWHSWLRSRIGDHFLNPVTFVAAPGAKDGLSFLESLPHLQEIQRHLPSCRVQWWPRPAAMQAPGKLLKWGDLIDQPTEE